MVDQNWQITPGSAQVVPVEPVEETGWSHPRGMGSASESNWLDEERRKIGGTHSGGGGGSGPPNPGPGDPGQGGNKLNGDDWNRDSVDTWRTQAYSMFVTCLDQARTEYEKWLEMLPELRSSRGVVGLGIPASSLAVL
eukprot:103461-Amphidinium_carterae.1